MDVRIISATHQDLAELVRQGRFRQDLYYRLNVIPIQMPALREMREDIPEIAQRMLERMRGDASVRFSEAALHALQDYSFPGNVRELENIIERALAMCSGGVIEVQDLQLVPVEHGQTDNASPDKHPWAANIRCRISGSGRRAGYAGGVAADRLQPHRSRQVAGGDVPCLALPHGAAGHQGPAWKRSMRIDSQGLLAGGEYIPSPNCDERPAGPIELLVIHNISLPPGEFGGDGVLRLFTNMLDVAAHPYYQTIAGAKVSAHFLVRRDGRIIQFVPCMQAGLACGRVPLAGQAVLQRFFARHRAGGQRCRAIHRCAI